VSSSPDGPELVRSEEELRSLYPTPIRSVLEKVTPALTPSLIRFVERSPLVFVATADAAGRHDVSPRGDVPGFVRVLDPAMLLIPDRKGNNRLDTLVNVLSQPRIALVALVPGIDDVVRINGSARITRDAGLLADSALDGTVPPTGLLVDVDEAFLHCGKALRRSSLWAPKELHARREVLSVR
jgi:PPOX class probable FMN-dependent enzyme